MPANDERAVEHRNHVIEDEVRREIELRAFFKYCERGCGHGQDVEDWLAAEREVRAAEGSAAAPDYRMGAAADSARRGRKRSLRAEPAARPSPR